MRDKPIVGMDITRPYEYRGHEIPAEPAPTMPSTGANIAPIEPMQVFRFYLNGVPSLWQGTPATWQDVKNFLERWADERIEEEEADAREWGNDTSSRT